MKTTYVCEFCGKSFEDMDECFECERSHIDIHQFDHESLYKPGEVTPEYILAFNNEEHDVYAKVRGISKDAEKVIAEYRKSIISLNKFVNKYGDVVMRNYKYHSRTNDSYLEYFSEVSKINGYIDFMEQYKWYLDQINVCYEKIEKLFLIKE